MPKVWKVSARDLEAHGAAAAAAVVQLCEEIGGDSSAPAIGYALGLVSSATIVFEGQCVVTQSAEAVAATLAPKIAVLSAILRGWGSVPDELEQMIVEEAAWGGLPALEALESLPTFDLSAFLRQTSATPAEIDTLHDHFRSTLKHCREVKRTEWLPEFAKRETIARRTMIAKLLRAAALVHGCDVADLRLSEEGSPRASTPVLTFLMAVLEPCYDGLAPSSRTIVSEYARPLVNEAREGRVGGTPGKTETSFRVSGATDAGGMKR